MSVLTPEQADRIRNMGRRIIIALRFIEKLHYLILSVSNSQDRAGGQE
jgi:hypothetical protein